MPPRLADAFRRHDLPVVLINVDGGAPGRAEQSRRVTEFPAGWTDLIPELNRQPSDHPVTKRTWGAFTNTGLDTHLKQSGVTQVVIAGVATSAGVESTARHAHELGFNVALAVDAMTDMNADAHHNSITRIFPRLGETGTTRRSSICSKRPRTANKGAPEHAMASLSGLLRRRRVSHQRHSASGQRRDGTPVSKPVRQTARRRPLLVDRERALGLLQPRRRISARLPCRRFRFALHRRRDRARDWAFFCSVW